MKKLMIAAAAAAMVTGAFASDGSAYQVRFNLRTLTPAMVVCDGSEGCELCGESWSDNINYYRPVTRNLKAILVRCINCGESITNLNNYVFAMWEEATSNRYTKGMKNVINGDIKAIQNNPDFQLKNYTDTPWVIKQFGSKGQYVSVEGWLNQGWTTSKPVGADLTFKGFGDGRTSDGRIGQVSGSVVGSLRSFKVNNEYGRYLTQTSNAVCYAFNDLCKNQGVLDAKDTVGDVPAFGYWTMRSVDGARDYSLKEIMGNGADILVK